ncbi:hypothetical protein NSK_001073 [Nannochloropsis salina CCMP1776]|uniref:Translation elongation factor P/YeiP central domain-containing protein n=1 Tax=Nannochloropsis salina CCMP1776 TaxID=1027361 RepID=A0A4D9DCA9_9STRA|nr:hypothetical protein NSK_001073 [Nannochloropsis salina CCMP1776]|eukprot:TFJ87723.1 hypothetical protein NSK_001073 [Nannochloropsis salina CCMP1776]
MVKILERLVIAVTSLSLSSAFLLPQTGKLLSHSTPKNGFPRKNVIVELTSNDLKNGLSIEVDGTPMRVIEFLHVKPGKGAAFVRSKLKNLLTGSSMEKTFRAGESVDEAQVMKTEMQFSYDDGDSYQFMNLETYETEGVPKTVFEANNQGNFLLEGMVVQGVEVFVACRLKIVKIFLVN